MWNLHFHLNLVDRCPTWKINCVSFLNRQGYVEAHFVGKYASCGSNQVGTCNSLFKVLFFDLGGDIYIGERVESMAIFERQFLPPSFGSRFGAKNPSCGSNGPQSREILDKSSQDPSVSKPHW